MSSPRIKVVVFDLGGVIVRICRSWREGCEAAGVAYHHQWEDPAAHAERLHHHRMYQQGRMETDAFFRAIAESASGVYHAEQVRRVHDAWLLGEYPGVGEVVDRIHQAGLRTGVLSNTNAAHWVRLAPGDAGAQGASVEYVTPNRVHHLHASHLMGMVKPDVEIYREFERLMNLARATRDEGALAPAEILFFDDLAENVEAARNAGWISHQVDHTGDTAAQMLACLNSLGALGPR